MGRKLKSAERLKLYRESLTEKENARRLEQNLSRISAKRSQECNEDRESRLVKIRIFHRYRKINETKDKRNERLAVKNRNVKRKLAAESAEERLKRISKIHERLENESPEKRGRRIAKIHERLENESSEKRSRRLRKVHERLQKQSAEERNERVRKSNENVKRKINSESVAERAKRLKTAKQRNKRRRSNESTEMRLKRLSQQKNRIDKSKKMSFCEQDFKEEIFQFADVPCSVCRRMLYPKQRLIFQITPKNNFLREKFGSLNKIEVCQRCRNALQKGRIPSQAFWNKMEVASQPTELLVLTEVELRLLARAVPFVRIIKVNNRFSQQWCKGQVILFAQDVAEIAEQLPLPLTDAGLVLIVESRENVHQLREFYINQDNVKTALKWLIRNNVLYRDVEMNFQNVLSYQIENIIDECRVEQPMNIQEVAQGDHSNKFKAISADIEIVRGSFHQGSSIFSEESCGRQCTAIAAIACFAFSTTDPGLWQSFDINSIVMSGDEYYKKCIAERNVPHADEEHSEYLCIDDLLPQVSFNNRMGTLTTMPENALNGHIDNDDIEFPNLKRALHVFFENHNAGILTANFISICVFKSSIAQSNTYFYLFDSHARGAKGRKASKAGTACCMRFKAIDDLWKIIKNTMKVKNSHGITMNVYSITPIRVDTEEVIDNVVEVPERDAAFNNKGGNILFTTNLLHAADDNIPDLEAVITTPQDQREINERRITDIHRKTAPPLNVDREKRVEELSWYFLYPDGRNGFGEPRDIPISTLDYYQARIMGQDQRFQRNDYLFYALSMVELERAKASVSVSCRMRQGEHIPPNLVDNIHLTMRNIRGSAAYWKKCCQELVAMVRCLGAPTWFVTFSCNDLHWPDMKKALCLADGRSVNENLSFEEISRLVEKYPVILARQFMVRVNALMRYLKGNDNILGGAVEDFWYRIEFQNRGSPHLHMLIWCKDIPDFTTNAGLNIIQQVVSCSLTSANKELVSKVQLHKHSSTCYKNRNTNTCRFGFPRPVSTSTVCLDPDTSLRNHGRFCVLQRTANETMVNNYNPAVLNLWQANMDIQPCGNVTAVAYYIAKYASKSEPNDCGDAMREAIQSARRQTTNVRKQLFSISMAILNKRLLCAQEAAFRLCHLRFKLCSRKAVFVNSCHPSERFRLVQFRDSETSVYQNIFDRYEKRPDSLNDLSLAEFSVRYESVSNPTWSEEDGDMDQMEEAEEAPAKYIVLKDNQRMRVRNKPAVLRHRYFTLLSDREAYFYNLIVLHIPFRAEVELMAPDETAEACFLRRRSELKPLLPGTSVEDFTHAEQMIQQALIQAATFSAINEEATNQPLNREDAENYDEVGHHHEVDINEEIIEDEVNTDMPQDVFLHGIQNLNVQQKDLMKAVSKIINHDLSSTEHDPLRLFVTGGAGSGKTFLLKLVVEQIKRCYAPTADPLLNSKFVEVAALTGVAARQICAKTLHSVFSLPIEKANAMSYRKMTGERLQRERQKWRTICWLIIDEISMVSYENLRIIHLRLQEFKNNSLLFGGINVLLFGDIMQLPPVKGHWCFMQPQWAMAEINLWQQFSFCELTINMRQRSDTEFVDLLNNLRFGELTLDQLKLLHERRRVEQSGCFADGAAVRIFPTLKLVEDYNTKMTENIKSRKVYIVDAVDESKEPPTYGQKPPANCIPADINNCGGQLHSIKLAVGSRVMLRRNISQSEGLVNGSMGVVNKFKWPALRRDQLEEGELPEIVHVQFDDESIGQRIKDADGCIAITPTTTTFQGNKGYGNIERRMLPLILSWAVTVHKLQGTTLDRAVIDLGPKNFAKGQVYVALSRVKTLDGVALSDLDPKKITKKPHDEKAMKEMQRLRQLKAYEST